MSLSSSCPEAYGLQGVPINIPPPPMPNGDDDYCTGNLPVQGNVTVSSKCDREFMQDLSIVNVYRASNLRVIRQYLQRLENRSGGFPCSSGIF